MHTCACVMRARPSACTYACDSRLEKEGAHWKVRIGEPGPSERAHSCGYGIKTGGEALGRSEVWEPERGASARTKTRGNPGKVREGEEGAPNSDPRVLHVISTLMVNKTRGPIWMGPAGGNLGPWRGSSEGLPRHWRVRPFDREAVASRWELVKGRAAHGILSGEETVLTSKWITLSSKL